MTHFDRGQAVGFSLSLKARKAILWVAVGAGLAFLLVGESRWPPTHFLHEPIEWVGLALIAACIIGRTWCSLYIGGRKDRDLITQGPYSISRNPLYFFSIIGAIGVGAQVGSIVIALTCGFIVWALHANSIAREEASLLGRFGDRYRHYHAGVPRILPRLSLWHDTATIEVKPSFVKITFVDALVFLTAWPIAEALEYLHESDWLPTWITLP
jgi:protein-S-isoprenylcysteine O-methyltransferase Ste14